MVGRMARRPGWPCALLLTAGVLALALGGFAVYGRHAVLSSGAFADRANRALHQDEVVDEISERIADREIEATRRLRGGGRWSRPRSATSSTPRSSPASSARACSRCTHRCSSAEERR